MIRGIREREPMSVDPWLVEWTVKSWDGRLAKWILLSGRPRRWRIRVAVAMRDRALARRKKKR